MISNYKKIFLPLAISFIASCSQVLETVTLELNNTDAIEQEEFAVVEKTITLSEAKAGNSMPFVRLVSRTGVGKDADLITENQALKSDYPADQEPKDYRLGVGDRLAFVKLIENSGQLDVAGDPWPENITNGPYFLGIGDQITLTQLNEDIVMSSALPLGLSGSGNTDDQGSVQSLTTLGKPTNVNNIIQTTGRVGSDGSVLLLEVGRLEALGKSII